MRWDGLGRGVAAVALLAFVACASEGERRLGEGQVAGEAGMELLWSVPGLHLISWPQAAWLDGDDELIVTVGIDDDDDELVLLAFDPDTGEELWRRPTTVSATPAMLGAPLPVIGGGRVYHLSHEPGGVTVEAVDLASGDVVWASEHASGGFSSHLAFCDTVEESLCVMSVDSGRWQVDVDTGEVRPGAESHVGPPDPGHEVRQVVTDAYLGADVYQLAGGDLARIVNGTLSWQRTTADLFGGASVSPDFGQWFYAPIDGLILGYLGPVPDLSGSDEVPIVTAPMVGLDAATGTTLWFEPGMPFCGRLDHVLGNSVVGVEWIRCIFTGEATFEDGRYTERTVETSTIEGFDPLTGETRWSVDMGPASALLDPDGVVMRLDATTFALHRDDGSLLVVDTLDGSSPRITDDDVAWCVTETYYIDGSLTRRGNELSQPCTIDGERQAVPVEPDDGVGLDVDGVFVWMDETGLHGAR